MQFRILGPLEVRGPSGPLKLGGRKQQGLLALLLLHPNRVVSADALIDGLWGGRPPESAPNALQVYVSGLRKILGKDALVTAPPGYELRVDPEQLDLACFERGIAEGRKLLAAGELDAACERLAEALGLWRGRPLTGLGLGQLAEAEAARLEELRLGATEDWIDAALALGRHPQLVGEVETLVAEQPFRERLHRQLALALYRSGRQADALDACRSLRVRLVDELGLEPTPALRALEQSILRQDPALELEQRAPAAFATAARKPVTALVVELAAPALDPEAHRLVGARFVRDTIATAEGHGAVADQTGPTRVLALFGLPTTREDDALRAASAALQLQRHGAVRIALASGQAIVSEGATLLEVGGPVAQQAARLCLTADPDTILLDPRAHALLRESAATEPVPSGWRLLGLAGGEAIPRHLDAPIVGRERELDALRAALDRAVAEGGCHLVSLIGPAGIGKSRLARELVAQAATGMSSVSGRCLSYGEGITFLPLAEIVRGLVGDDLRAGLDRVLSGERQGSLVAERLAAALGVEAGESTPEQTSWAVRRLFEAVARRQPLLVCLEDAHWADPMLLDLVDYLAEWLRTGSVLLVVTGRPELLDLRPDWDSPGARQMSLQLEPLGGRAVAAMIRNLLGDGTVDAALRRRIALAAEGNPLFVEQMAAMLGEEPSDAAHLAVPPTLHALLTARLDLLAPQELVALGRAAVVGREFDVEAVAVLAHELERDQLVSAFESLWRKQLLDSSGAGAFRFRHQLIADVVYETLPKLLRSDLHERLAAWLETAAAEPALELDALVGYHLERAVLYLEELEPGSRAARRLGERARVRLAAAGRRAYAQDRLPAAISLLRRAVALAANAHAEDLLTLAQALRESGDFAQARSAAEQAVEAARASSQAGLRARATLTLIHLQSESDSSFSFEAGLRAAAAELAVLERAGGEAALGEAWFVIASMHLQLAQSARTIEALDHAIREARRADDRRTLAAASVLRASVSWFGAEPAADAIARCESVLADPQAPPRVEAAARRALGALYAIQGRFDEAREQLAADRELLTESGLRLATAVSLYVGAYVELLAGDVDAAESMLREGIDLLAGTSERSRRSALEALLAEVLHRRGSVDEALALTRLAEAGCMADDVLTQADWRSVRARVLAVQGRLEEAERLARDAVELLAASDFLESRARSLLGLAEVLEAMGRAAEAVSLVEEASRLFEQKGNLVSVERTERLLASGAVTALSAKE